MFPELVGVQAEFAELWMAVKGLHTRVVLSMPIIKEFHKEEEVQNIWGIKDSTTPAGADNGENGWKKKKTKRTTEKENFKAVKVASIHCENNRQWRIHLVVGRAGIYQPTNVANLSNSAALLPKLLLSAPATTSSTIDTSIVAPTGSSDDKSGAHLKAFCTDTAWVSA